MVLSRAGGRVFAAPGLPGAVKGSRVQRLHLEVRIWHNADAAFDLRAVLRCLADSVDDHVPQPLRVAHVHA